MEAFTKTESAISFRNSFRNFAPVPAKNIYEKFERRRAYSLTPAVFPATVAWGFSRYGSRSSKEEHLNCIEEMEVQILPAFTFTLRGR
jgi:hypothetical protein